MNKMYYEMLNDSLCALYDVITLICKLNNYRDQDIVKVVDYVISQIEQEKSYL